jgi:hypothetical protein
MLAGCLFLAPPGSRKGTLHAACCCAAGGVEKFLSGRKVVARKNLWKIPRFSKALNLTPEECDIGFKCGRTLITRLRADRGAITGKWTNQIRCSAGQLGGGCDGTCSLPSSIKANRPQGRPRKATGRVVIRNDSRAAERVIRGASSLACDGIPDRVKRTRQRLVFREFLPARMMAHLRH